MMEANQLAGEQTDAEIAIEVPSTEGVLRAVSAGADVTDWPEQPQRVVNEAYSDTCDVTRRDTTSTLCEFGNVDSDRTVVMFGDSHAAMWIPALDRIGKQNDWKVIQLTKPGCVAPDLQIWSNSLGREYAECDQWRDWAVGQIAEIEPDVLAGDQRGQGHLPGGRRQADAGRPGRRLARRDWDRRWTRSTPHAGRVVVIGDMAYPAQPGIDCLTEHEGNVSACNTPVEQAVLADHNRVERETAEAHGAEYVDIIPWFCTQETCPAVIGDLTVHRDALHINENYAVFLSVGAGGGDGADARLNYRASLHGQAPIRSFTTVSAVPRSGRHLQAIERPSRAYSPVNGGPAYHRPMAVRSHIHRPSGLGTHRILTTNPLGESARNAQLPVHVQSHTCIDRIDR